MVNNFPFRFTQTLPILLLCIAAATFLGCGNQTPENNNKQMPATDNTTQITRSAVKDAQPILPDTPPSPPAITSSTPLFIDATSELGIDFHYFNDKQSGRFLNVEVNGGGVGWVDFDLDDFPDLYFTNGCKLHPPGQNEPQRNLVHGDRLFHNQLGKGFGDVTTVSGTGDTHFSHGIAVGDFDNDGWPDLFVANFGPNTFYRNNGDGTFAERSTAMLPSDYQWSSSAAFGDLDRDGDLDLYVTTYAKVDWDNIPICKGTDFRVYCSPEKYGRDNDRCFLNNGQGQFELLTAEHGIDKTDGYGMGVVIADLDNDNWPDIYVANDKTPGVLFHNRTQGLGEQLRFEERGVEAGVAFDGQGNLMAGMGVACGDADRDGLLDLYVTHYHRESDTFYRNLGTMCFADDTARAGLGAATLPFLGFGAEFFDYDNNGWLDLIVANGHVLGPQYWIEAMEMNLYRNQGQARFINVSSQSGPHFARKFTSRGLAIADYDRDGGMDVAVTNNNEPAYVLRNTCDPRGTYLALSLVGRPSARSAANTRVFVRQGEKLLAMYELTGAGSYQSASEQQMHIGLGDIHGTVELEIRWPSGRVDELSVNAAVGSMVVVENR